MQFEPATPFQNFGLRVKGLKLSEMSKAQSLVISSALYNNAFIVFESQKLSELEFIKFGKSFGDLNIFVDKEYTHPEFPEIFVVSNIKINGKRFGMDRVGLYWHSDCSFLREPQPLTMLSCQECPPKGGETAFIDMRQVWRELDSELVSDLRKLSCEHQGQTRYIICEKDVGMSIKEVIDRDLEHLPKVIHPAHVVHPIAKTEALYVNEGFTSRILNSEQLKSSKILDYLFSRIENEAFHYKHVWNKNEIIIWDNRSVVHKAYPVNEGNQKLMHRLGINDGSFFG